MRFKNTKRRQTKRRQTKYRSKIYGGRAATNRDIELIDANNENMEVDDHDDFYNTLIGLGFEDEDIDMVRHRDLDSIILEYKRMLTSTDNGFGLVELTETPIEDIINASDLNVLTNTNIRKNRVATQVVSTMMDFDGGRKRRRKKRK